jgi:phage gp36-like protein
MPYATRKDLEEIYGDRMISMLADLRDVAHATRDLNGDGMVTPEDAKLEEARLQTEIDDRVSKALEAATAEIDAYVCVKYPLPLPSVPRILINVCRDIAIYRMGATQQTTEMRQRYEDAVELLGKISSGKAMLAFPGIVNQTGIGGLPGAGGAGSTGEPGVVAAPKPRSRMTFGTRRGN